MEKLKDRARRLLLETIADEMTEKAKDWKERLEIIERECI